MVSPGRWEGLPPDVRTILEEEARATQAFVYETAARMDEELLVQIGQAGVSINAPEADAFLRASTSMYEEYAEAVGAGADLVSRAEAAGSR